MLGVVDAVNLVGRSKDFERDDGEVAVNPADNAPCPCDGCEHRSFCADKGLECPAFKLYISVKGRVVNWTEADRNPLATRRPGRKVGKNPKASVFHDGHPFVRGSASEQLYLHLKDTGPHSNRELQQLLAQDGIEFTLATVGSLMHQLRSRGAAERVENLWVAR